MENKTIQELSEELWDRYSEDIGDKISDLDYWFGRTVMTEESFFKLMEKLHSRPASPPSPAIEGEEELDWLESFNREEVKNILMEFSYDFQQEKYGGCSTHRHIVSLFIKAHRELFSTPTPPAGAEGEGEKMEQVGLFDILDQAIDEEVAEKLSAARTTIAELEAKVRDLQDWIHSHQ